jgi:[ribosomal protein S5]-alanine N-acetyltransferase
MMPELEPLRASHAPAILAFELANRAYFAASISDRGDEYFEHFTERHNALLADQEAGNGAYYLLRAEDGSVVGRFKLVFVAEGVAELATASHNMSPAMAWQLQPWATSARSPRRDTASTPSEPPLPTATRHPSACCSRPASFVSGRPIQQTWAGSRAPAISGTSYSGQRVMPEIARPSTS